MSNRIAAIIFGCVSLAGLAAPSSAAVISFSGTGQVAPGGPPVGPVLTLTVLTPTTSYTLGRAAGWRLESSFDFNLATNQGVGTFRFFDSVGPGSLFGTFTSTTPALGAPFALTYTVNGGTGAYAGFVGTGSSTTTLLGDPNQPPTPFSEAGRLDVRVPEPATFGLLGLALGGALLARRRRSAEG
jgi:hypothetical protein